MSLFDQASDAVGQLLAALDEQMRAARSASKRQTPALKGATRPRPQRKSLGASMDSYKRPEPTGYRPSSTQLGMAIIRADVEASADGDRVMEIYSGDGKQKLTWVEPQDNTDYATLQIGPPKPANPVYDIFGGAPRTGLHPTPLALTYLIEREQISDHPACDGVCITGPGIQAEERAYYLGAGGAPRVVYDKITRGFVAGTDITANIVLPVGADKLIVARRNHITKNGQFLWGIGECTSTYSVQEFTTGPDPKGCCSEKGYTTLLNAVYSHQVSNGKTETFFTATTEKCFLVSHTAVKEITTIPPSALSMLAQLAPQPSGAVPVEYNNQKLFAGGEIEATVDLGAAIAYDPASNVYLPFFSRYGLWPLFQVQVEGGLTYGVSAWTAGIYASRNSISGSLSGTPAEDQAAYSATGAPVPRKWLFACKGPAVCGTQPGEINFASTSQIPDAYLGNPDLSGWASVRRALKGRVPSVGDNAEVLLGWDWDSPSYCREQLLGMGFSVEDLTM
jgi:hypothetical protein